MAHTNSSRPGCSNDPSHACSAFVVCCENQPMSGPHAISWVSADSDHHRGPQPRDQLHSRNHSWSNAIDMTNPPAMQNTRALDLVPVSHGKRQTKGQDPATWCELSSGILAHHGSVDTGRNERVFGRTVGRCWIYCMLSLTVAWFLVVHLFCSHGRERQFTVRPLLRKCWLARRMGRS